MRILIADDHNLFRQALRELIRTFHFSAEMFDAADGIEVLKILSQELIDVVLLDIQMPRMNGFETLQQIRHMNYAHVRVIMMTQFHEAMLISRSISLGSNGYLLKNCESDELESAILSTTDTFAGNNVKKEIPDLHLSRREFEVLSLLACGESNKGIAGRLGITLRTVESYRKNVLKKTRCRNTADLVSLAYRTGLLPM